MIRNATQREKSTHKDNAPASKAQLVIDLKRRILKVKETLLGIHEGVEYMPFFLAQAAREGRQLTSAERKALGQIMSLRVFSGDVERVEFIERSIEAMKR